MKRSAVIAVVLAVFLPACAAPVPFERARAAETGDVAPRTVADAYGNSLPGSFHLLSSVVFEFGPFTISGLGYLQVDRSTGRFKVACLNHLGVKIFEFEGDRSGLSSRYVIEPLARQGHVAEAVAGDIMRIYLDMVPPPDARAVRKRDGFLFRRHLNDGVLEYVFSGEGFRLTRKTYREDQRAVWRVSYYEYLDRNGKLYPGGVILTNFRHGYRLIVRQKEILE